MSPTTAAGDGDPPPPVEQAHGDPATSRAVATRRSRASEVAALALVTVAGVVAGVTYLVQEKEPAAPSASGGSSRATTSPPAATPSSALHGDPVAMSPRVTLDALVEADRAEAEALVGSWVPQISSKEVGTVDDGRSYDEVAILAEINAAKARHPQAVVVRSDDYTSFRRPGFWVTLVATPTSSPDGVAAWCDENGLGPDDCFAKRLSHSDGPAGNTVPR
jgi:hypothetical protein